MKSLLYHTKTNLLLSILGMIFLFISCDHKIQTSRKRPDFLPNHAAIILKCANLEKAKANLKETPLVQENRKSKAVAFFEKNLILKHFSKTNAGFSIGLSPTAKNTYEATYLTKDSIFSKYITKTPLEKFKGFNIYEFELESAPFWISKFEDTYVICSNKSFLKACIEQFRSNKDFNDNAILKSWDSEAIASFYINLEKIAQPLRLLDGLPAQLTSKGQLAGDLTLNNQNFMINGVFHLDKGNTPVNFSTRGNHNLFELFPSIKKSYSLNTPIKISDSLEIDKKGIQLLVENIESYGILETSNKAILGLKVLESFDTNSLFNSISESDSLSVKKLKQVLSTKDLHIPLNNSLDSLKFGFIKNKYLLLGDEASLNNISKTTVTPEKLLTYKEITKTINQESAYLNIKESPDFFNSLGISDTLKATEYPLTGISLQQSRDYGYLQVFVPKKVSQPKRIKNLQKVFEMPVSEPIKNGPYLFKNHLTKDNEIVLQTENYKLQRFSAQGKLLWSKPLNEPILGTIHEIDIYSNGRLQTTFVTPSKWYILDRNGKDVSVFPKNFKNEITQPLSLFDYDNNKKYRFGITQGDSFLVYDKKGKKVGFNFKNTNKGEITLPPKHVRIGNKDFIVINEQKGGIHFLSRTGKERIELRKPIHSKKPWFFYKNTFSTLDKDGFLTQVSTDGKMGKVKKHPTDQFSKIDATSKTWVTFTGNELHIKNNKATLEFGSYTNPKIFYIKDKIYVAISNQENDTAYLFDSNAKLIKDFPIKGSSSIIIKLDKSRKFIDIVTYDTNNALLLYKLRVP